MLKNDFPFFKNSDCIYLDTAATAQKPKIVIDTLQHFYTHEYGTVHRAVYDLSLKSTEKYENARQKIATFINADLEEIVFTKGTTDSINLVARAFPLKKGDEIIISQMEHHSNIVPWQLLQKEKGINIKIIPVDDNGELILEEYKKLFTDKTKLVSISHISNVLGTINPIKKIIELAHQKSCRVLIDGAQAIGHQKIDVRDLDADFYAFSSHKAYGPTGIGILYGKKDLLNSMPPVQGGGDMIEHVSFEKTTFQKAPMRFEAGTPMIAQVIGFGAAIDYIDSIGMKKIETYENGLLHYALTKLSKIKGINILGPKINRAPIISFTIKGTHPLDIATFLNLKNIAIRSGHQCALPLLNRFGLSSCLRLSFGIYNTTSDIDFFMTSLAEILAAI